jgi:hypothetical protein
MLARSGSAWRRGSILPLVAISLIGLFGFLALAVDVGLIVLARSHCQRAADAAAMAGARTLNGDSGMNNNEAKAQTNAVAGAGLNTILSEPVLASQVKVELGSYTYDYGKDKFLPLIPRHPYDNWNLVKATVSYHGRAAFARVFGLTSFDAAASATAVHRPRDVAVILDFSGSMRFDSLLGIPYNGPRTASNNPESVFPLFGHYSDVPGAALQNTKASTTIDGNIYGSSNVTVATPAGEPIVGDFYQHASAGTPLKAFSPAPDAYAASPDGDNYLVKFGTKTNPPTYGKTVQEITGGARFEGYIRGDPFNGYSGPQIPNFQGYTLGPRYWGKTFFLWPPDPRNDKDWRGRFFKEPGSNRGVDDNTRLWDSGGNWKAPSSSTYEIDYDAILSWLKRTGPNLFPSRLRAGRIVYYDAIPDHIDTGSFPPSDRNQRFWKEYIDYVLGVRQVSSGWYTVITPSTGYGDDFAWGTPRISPKPRRRYMSYNDNPKRPRLHFWFGPMTLVDFLGNYNLGRFWWPGTCHEAPLLPCKLGIQAALEDVQNNHPNDFVALTMFSTPEYQAGDGGRFNQARVPLGRNYLRLRDTLWFPPVTIDNPGTEIRPYSAGMNESPRAMGGTCPAMGFMLAYNQFSGDRALRTHAPYPAPEGLAGGLGRKGAQKLVILETDGMANTPADATFVNQGPYESYYRVRPPFEYPQGGATSVSAQLYDVVDRICARDTDSPPGYSRTHKPVLIHCLAFGTLFESFSTDPDKAAALQLLQRIQYMGKTQASPGDALPAYKIITGTNAERIDKLRQAFRAIMQDGIQVSLID